MAKYLVETYYTCSFKVDHYLDDINEAELSNLEKRDDGKFEVLDVKLDTRKTKNLDPNNKVMEKNKDVQIFVTGVSMSGEAKLNEHNRTPKEDKEESKGEEIGNSREDD